MIILNSVKKVLFNTTNYVHKVPNLEEYQRVDKSNYEETYSHIKYHTNNLDKWRNRYRKERMEKYANHHNPEHHRHAHYMKAYKIEEKLAQCRKLKEEIEEIYNRPLPVESPPSDNFYVDKHYEYDPYPIWEPSDKRFDSTHRKSYKNTPKSFKNNFNR